MTTDNSTSNASTDFIRAIIQEDLQTNKYGGRVNTRFPPEPNGYLHIGHAKSICLNFGIAQEFGGRCNLRFDDTNPCKEEVEYVDSIMEDVRWLGFDWEDRLFYASDYFEQIYQWAVQLIKAGKAYVCDLSADEVRETRGTLTEPGTNSPYRNRSIEENLELFERMRAGEFPDGSRTLRAKIDMASPNLNLRDPVMYRILHATHHRSGDQWCIYPTYDFTHGQSDSIERITHSICTLEFENHRPLYDWYIRELGIYAPQQIEFARLNLTYTVMSKRRLLELVKEGCVSGWDDPRMPTICGLRRRGYTPEAMRNFCAADRRVESRQRGGHRPAGALPARGSQSPGAAGDGRAAAAPGSDRQLSGRPSRTDGGRQQPGRREHGHAQVPFSRELYIEQDDFREVPPKKYHRLAPGQEVRLRYAYLVRCTRVVKDPQTGEPVEVHCTLRPGHARRQHARRPQGEGDDPLGFGRPRAAGRGAAVRPPVHQARSGRRAGGPGLQGELEPQLLAAAGGLLRGAEPDGRRAGQPLPVRAAGLFLRRPRFDAADAGFQPHGVAGRHVGEDSEEGVREGLGMEFCQAIRSGLVARLYCVGYNFSGFESPEGKERRWADGTGKLRSHSENAPGAKTLSAIYRGLGEWRPFRGRSSRCPGSPRRRGRLHRCGRRTCSFRSRGRRPVHWRSHGPIEHVILCSAASPCDNRRTMPDKPAWCPRVG